MLPYMTPSLERMGNQACTHCWPSLQQCWARWPAALTTHGTARARSHHSPLGLLQTASKKLDVETPQQKAPRHRAVVRFMTAEVAARAVRNLHGQYLLNTPVAIRLIH